jgi:hypothetical protein
MSCRCKRSRGAPGDDPDHIDYKSVEHLHPDQMLPASVVRFPAISVIELPSAGNGYLVMSSRPAFSRPLAPTALLPLFVACGSSDSSETNGAEALRSGPGWTGGVAREEIS